MKVVLLGPPGSGKGTQAEGIAQGQQIPKVSSGDLFRDHHRKGTALGDLARSYMDRGVLVPDEVTIKMVMTWVDENKSAGGFVLDGFPRTLNQAEALDRALSNDGGIDRVLYINVPQKELIRRLTGRLICQNCQRPYQKVSAPSRVAGRCDACGEKLYQRDDDKGEAVYERLRVYQSETEPLISYYSNANILYEIDGENSVEKVKLDLVNALNS